MGKSNFSRAQCIRALKELGFTKDTIRHGKHDKFYPPIAIVIQPGEPEFIMIPRHGKLRCQFEILKELKAMGGEELEKAFIENL
jgi:hypothetical protein